MTTNNTPWSLGSCPNNSLNSVEPSVPPQPASDPSLILNNGRSTPVTPPLFSPDRLEASSDAPGTSPKPGCSLVFEESNSFSPSENGLNCVKNSGISAHCGLSSHTTQPPQKLPNNLHCSNKHPKTASAHSEKNPSNVRNPGVSTEVATLEHFTGAHDTAHYRTLPFLDAVAETAAQSKPLSFNDSQALAQCAINRPSTPPAGSRSSSSKTNALSLLPSISRERKFRADSFAAKLTPDQRRTLIHWLADEDLLLVDIQRKIAAPPPEGFGLHVHHVTVRRLRSMYQNTDLEHWLSQAMDAACDILEPANGAEIAPLRESLIYILYSQVIQKSRKLFAPREFNHCIAAIERLEKMKARAEQQSYQSPRQSAPQGHLRVDLKIHHPKTKKRRPIKIVASQHTGE